MAFFVAALAALVVLLLVLLLVDIDISQSRRIEKQVERDRRRIRAKTLRGWSADRIARRYPALTPEHIRVVRRQLARNVEADHEIRLLKSMWLASEPETSSDG